jgi:RNA polymerase sigma-70 factor (sigma-E family)
MLMTVIVRAGTLGGVQVVVRGVDDLEALITGKYEPLRRAAFVLTGNVDAADDLVQVALLKVTRSAARLREASDVDAYLHKVLVNTHRTLWRRRWRGEVATGWVPEPEASAGDPAVLIRQSLLTALSTLSAGQRQVVVLRHMADFSEAATAEALGCSLGTVKSRSARALGVLRRHPALLALVAPEEVDA